MCGRAGHERRAHLRRGQEEHAETEKHVEHAFFFRCKLGGKLGRKVYLSSAFSYMYLKSSLLTFLELCDVGVCMTIHILDDVITKQADDMHVVAPKRGT